MRHPGLGILYGFGISLGLWAVIMLVAWRLMS